MSGCLWSLIPFPILIALYSVIRQPITRMMFCAEDFVTVLQDFFVEHGLYEIPARANAYLEIQLTKLAHDNWDLVQSGLAGKIDPNFMDIDFSFLGLNMGDQPRWNFFMDTDWSDVHVWLPALGLFLIPFISAFLSWVSMKISQQNQSADRTGRTECLHHEHHESHDAPDEHLDLLHHAGCHGYLLDCQLRLRHYS